MLGPGFELRSYHFRASIVTARLQEPTDIFLLTETGITATWHKLVVVVATITPRRRAYIKSIMDAVSQPMRTLKRTINLPKGFSGNIYHLPKCHTDWSGRRSANRCAWADNLKQPVHSLDLIRAVDVVLFVSYVYIAHRSVASVQQLSITGQHNLRYAGYTIGAVNCMWLKVVNKFRWHFRLPFDDALRDGCRRKGRIAKWSNAKKKPKWKSPKIVEVRSNLFNYTTNMHDFILRWSI